jgi:hypothetical protein
VSTARAACSSFEVAIRQPSTVGHRVTAVEAEIEDDLLEVDGVCAHRQLHLRESRVELDVLADQPSQHRDRGGDAVVEVDEPGLRRASPAEGEQLAGQRPCTIGRIADAEQVGTRLVVGGPGLERELRVAGDRSQEVVEVVRDPACEPSDRLHLLRLAKLFFEAVLLGFGSLLRADVEQEPL